MAGNSMCSKGSNCLQTLSTESGTWPSGTMIILKQAKSENDKVQQWWMLWSLLPGSAFIFIHRFWSGTPSTVRMALSRWSKQHSLRALSLFDVIVVYPLGQELAKSESRVLRQRRRVTSWALPMQPAKATRPSTRQVKVSAHSFIFVDWDVWHLLENVIYR